MEYFIKKHNSIILRVTRSVFAPLRKFTGLLIISTFVLCSVGLGYTADDYLSSINASENNHYYPSKIRFAVETSTKDRTSFYVDYLFPLWYAKDETSLVFFNPKQTFHSTNSEETNLGIGYRKLINDWYILGAHVFYDKKYSENKAWHAQMGYGLEFLTEDIDIRANYYNPIHGAKQVDEGYLLGETSLLYWNELEEPLEGFDFEVGVPVFEDITHTRFYAGGYFYDSKLTKDVEGLKVRAETNINDWLALDLGCTSENKQELEFTGGLRVTIPLELGKAFDRREREVKRFLDIFEVKQRSQMRDRLLERVVRDIDVQTAAKTNTPVVPSWGNIQQIIYVDGMNGGAESGTLSKPWNSLNDVAADPRYVDGVTLYVDRGDGTPYVTSLALKDNVTVWGSGYDNGLKGIETQGYPILTGTGVFSNILTLADNNEVMGLQIQNTGQERGIKGDDVTGFNIHHNIFTQFSGNARYPIDIDFANPGTYSGTITNNTINEYRDAIISNATIDLYTSCANCTVDLTVSENHIYDNDNGGIDVYSSAAGATSVVNAVIMNNTITDNGYFGIYVGANKAVVTATISGNTLEGNAWNTGGGNIHLNSQNTGFAATTTLNATVTNNIAINGADEGIFIQVRNDAGPTTLNARFSGNTITGNADNGVRMRNVGAGNTAVVDFGGGALGAAGNNSIYNNTTFDFNNPTAFNASAEDNWWGQNPPAAGQFNGLIDYTPYLTAEP
ncbi:MAG: inverse autotransporter beta domain-containing protein [Candidatus Omnitrophica bacterium]|nr:inverse autotransporter beta domain-containing protein [Candidatus Omnitrophota bacterium]